MKTRKTFFVTFSLIVWLLAIGIAFAQTSPFGFHYKTKLIDNNGAPITNQSVDVKFTIMDDAFNVLYQEGHSAITDGHGILDLVIGEGTPLTGDFSSLIWAPPMNLNVQIDLGNGFVDFGTQEFKYVPFSKSSDLAMWALGINFNDISNVPNGLSDGDDVGATKIDELSDGKTDASGFSVFLGHEAGLNDDGSNNNNTGLGYKALRNTTSGSNNTAVGASALIYNTTGNSNSAFGSSALLANTTGNKNSTFGFESMAFNTNGSENTAVGYRALNKNTTGGSNTAVGFESLKNNTDGVYNTALGYQSLLGNSNGHNGYYNVAIGYWSLKNNLTSGYNVAVGPYAMESNSTGDHNTAVGTNALKSNDDGDYNVAIGSNALVNNQTGHTNVVIGYQALSNAITNNPTYNVIIGSEAGYNSGGPTNLVAVGFQSGYHGWQNTATIGNSSMTWIGGQVTWSTFSDRRFKRDIQENVPGLEFINRLRPVTYHFDIHKQNEKVFRGDKKKLSADWPGKYDIEKITMTGFIAQEVEQAAKEIGYDFSGVQKTDNDLGIYSISYAQFVVPLVKAVQELSEKVNKLENENKALKEKLESELAKQKQEIEQLKQLIKNHNH